MVEITTLDPTMVFVKEYVATGDALAACITADIRYLDDMETLYPRAVIAQRMLEKPEVQAAIKAVRMIQNSPDPVEITHRSIAADMEKVFAEAMRTEDFKAAISAKNLQANVLGLLEQKISFTMHKSVIDMTDEELIAIINKKRPMIDVTPTKANNGTTEDTE